MNFRGRKARTDTSGENMKKTSRKEAEGRRQISRLERLLFRIDAQHKSLGWAFREIEAIPGLVFELGLGHGRTYDHMRRHLPEREIFVFDREIDCFADCRPDDGHLVLGQLAETLPASAARFGGKAILVNSDVGTYDEAYNVAVAELVSRHLPPLLAPGAIVLSDLPLTLAGSKPVRLPPGARDERFFIYRAAG
ncbi:MAG TPA: class I SAM-dependent methyltransferase [Bradyrhizobium sp.]|nr:class I SAM-dependent methyltransferase [Bradyrhizobium sp.]